LAIIDPAQQLHRPQAGLGGLSSPVRSILGVERGERRHRECAAIQADFTEPPFRFSHDKDRFGDGETGITPGDFLSYWNKVHSLAGWHLPTRERQYFKRAQTQEVMSLLELAPTDRTHKMVGR
jgi:hypothetical protein